MLRASGYFRVSQLAFRPVLVHLLEELVDAVCEALHPTRIPRLPQPDPQILCQMLQLRVRLLRKGLGFIVWRVRSMVQGVGFIIYGLDFGVSGTGYRVQGSGFWEEDLARDSLIVNLE